MMNEKWLTTELPGETPGLVWEQFHENSKIHRYTSSLPTENILAEMDNLYPSLPYTSTEVVLLPDGLEPIESDFSAVVLERTTAQSIRPQQLTLLQLRTLLHFAYGVTRPSKSNALGNRDFRTTPSGGALYPLEIYFYSSGYIEGLSSGLYHYSPDINGLHKLKLGNYDKTLKNLLIESQSELANQLSVTFFITGIFKRSIFKYGDRGYRFALLEAGHISQNILLTANALGYATISLGGFYDRQVNEFLEIDGLNHSILHLIGIGAR